MPIVETAITAPVTDMSSCVAPCWTRSPTITSRTSSKAVISLSSRLPRARVNNHRARKTPVVRKTMSMGRLLRDAEQVGRIPDGCGSRQVPRLELHAHLRLPVRSEDAHRAVRSHLPCRRDAGVEIDDQPVTVGLVEGPDHEVTS